MGGFGLAGALAGAGQGLSDWAAEQRKQAAEMLQMKEREKIRREGAEWNAEFKASQPGKAGRGSRSGGGATSEGSGKPLSARELDDVARLYKSSFGEDEAFDGPVPSMAEYQSYIERTRQPGESLSQAADRTSRDWSVRDEVTTTEKPRSPLSPFRLFGSQTYPETESKRVGGFGAALAGEPAADAAAPNAEVSPQPAPAAPAAAPAAPTKSAALQQARAALAKGADRQAVIARLREMGIDPEGL